MEDGVKWVKKCEQCYKVCLLYSFWGLQSGWDIFRARANGFTVGPETSSRQQTWPQVGHLNRSCQSGQNSLSELTPPSSPGWGRRMFRLPWRLQSQCTRITRQKALWIRFLWLLWWWSDGTWHLVFAESPSQRMGSPQLSSYLQVGGAGSSGSRRFHPIS